MHCKIHATPITNISAAHYFKSAGHLFMFPVHEVISKGSRVIKCVHYSRFHSSKRHNMVTRPALQTLWKGNHQSPVDCSHKSPVMQGFGCVYILFVGLRPVIQILCHVLARGWGRWLRYFTEAKAEVKYRASARIRGPKHDTRFEWPVTILIMTRHPFLPFKTHKTSAKNPCLLTISGAIWFCRFRQCTPSQLWMHAPVAKERRLMTSQYPIFDRTDNLNP